jgi:transposase
LNPDEVVMESTGIYWKSPYAALEAVGIRATVVNARHVKQVPGRKTDVGDAQWLGTPWREPVCSEGLSCRRPKLRELRLIARQRQKLVGLLTVREEPHAQSADRCRHPLWAWWSATSMVSRHAR